MYVKEGSLLNALGLIIVVLKRFYKHIFKYWSTKYKIPSSRLVGGLLDHFPLWVLVKGEGNYQKYISVSQKSHFRSFIHVILQEIDHRILPIFLYPKILCSPLGFSKNIRSQKHNR